jgi:uncharacterized cupin superfamily protein
VRIQNIHTAELGAAPDREGFRSRRGRIGYALGTRRLGISLWELPAGQAAYPYHYHHAEEELLLVVDGAPSLRTPDGWSDLQPGDVVCCPCGESGAHQLVNRTTITVRVISLSTNGEPEVVVFPDSGKIAADQRLPLGGGLRAVFRLAEQTDLLDGERYPSP